jgi:hypothetical protein
VKVRLLALVKAYGLTILGRAPFNASEFVFVE